MLQRTDQPVDVTTDRPRLPRRRADDDPLHTFGQAPEIHVHVYPLPCWLVPRKPSIDSRDRFYPAAPTGLGLFPRMLEQTGQLPAASHP